MEKHTQNPENNANNGIQIQTGDGTNEALMMETTTQDDDSHIPTTCKDSERFENFDVEEFLSRSARLGPVRKRNLYEAPEFVQRLNAFEEAKVGTTVVFACKWKGCPKPSIKWYKDDEEVTDNPRYCVTEEKDGLLKLTVESARKDDEGAYKVKAENSEGVSSSTGYLSVTGDAGPSEPRSQSTSQAHRSTKNIDHTVSFPPQLRTIVEQQSVEEREAEETSNLPPSPIQCYLDSFRRGHAGPLFPGCAVPPSAEPGGEADDSDSDTSVESQTSVEELFIIEDGDELHTHGKGKQQILPEIEDVRQGYIMQEVPRKANVEMKLGLKKLETEKSGNFIKSALEEKLEDFSNNIDIVGEVSKENNTLNIPFGCQSEISHSERDRIDKELPELFINEDATVAEVITSSPEDILSIKGRNQSESSDQRLAEDFEEFMKAKRKNVEFVKDGGNALISVQPKIDTNKIKVIGSDTKMNEPQIKSKDPKIDKSKVTINCSGSPYKLPDVIQYVTHEDQLETGSMDLRNAEDRMGETITETINCRHQPKISQSLPQNTLPPVLKMVNTIPEIKKDISKTECQKLTSTVHGSNEIIFTSGFNPIESLSKSEVDVMYEFPWLYYFALASASTFLGTSSNVSPFIYTLLWVAISLLSFHFFVKEKKETP